MRLVHEGQVQEALAIQRQGGGQIGRCFHQTARCGAGQPAGCQWGRGHGQLPKETQFFETGVDGCAEGGEPTEQTQAGMDFEQQGVRRSETEGGSEAPGPAGDVGEGGQLPVGIAFDQAEIGR